MRSLPEAPCLRPLHKNPWRGSGASAANEQPLCVPWLRDGGRWNAKGGGSSHSSPIDL